jgi:hypothetical protein
MLNIQAQQQLSYYNFFKNLFAQIFFHFLWPTINGEKKKMKRDKSWNSIMYTIWMEYLSLWSKN